MERVDILFLIFSLTIKINTCCDRDRKKAIIPIIKLYLLNFDVKFSKCSAIFIRKILVD